MSGTILITGATGYIGSMLVKQFLKDNNGGEVVDKLLLLVRDRQKAKNLFASEMLDTGIEVRFVECSLENLDIDLIDMSVDYIIHCAAPTTSSYMISHPVETADSIVLGTRNILELARRKNVKSMVYLSSMEVYGSVADIGRPRKEEELGEIRLDSARSCYSLGKRMAEHYCHIYTQEYGVPVKIARLAQTFGTGVRPEDNRVYMQFARAVEDKVDIVLKTEGLSVGNYCAIEDAVNAILTILDKGVDGECYNVVNESNTMRIKEMAQLVAEQVAGGAIEVRIELEDSAQTGYAPDTELRLSGEKLRALGWLPTKTIVEMYNDVIREITNKNIEKI